MPNSADILALLLVGALWGCTNPLLRKGATEAKQSNENMQPDRLSTINSSLFTRTVSLLLTRFRSFSVWLPYLLNQGGSLLFYFALSKSDLSLAVPICNGLSLVFSIVTSYMLGERVDQPLRTVFGSAFIMCGVAVCLLSRDEVDSSYDEATGAFKSFSTAGR